MTILQSLCEQEDTRRCNSRASNPGLAHRSERPFVSLQFTIRGSRFTPNHATFVAESLGRDTNCPVYETDSVDEWGLSVDSTSDSCAEYGTNPSFGFTVPDFRASWPSPVRPEF